MKIIDQYWAREVSGTYIAVPIRGKARELSCIVNLNASGALLFGLLQKGTTEAGLTRALQAEYDVSPAEADSAVAQFVETLQTANLLEA